MTSLGISIASHSCLQHDIVIELLIICVNIQSDYSFHSPFIPFMSYLLINIWWDWCFVHRSIYNINIVSEIMVGRSSISQKQAFWQIFAWNLSNSSKIQNCTKSQGLPLNTPSKELVDQACLIDHAGCDERLECVGYLTLHCPFCFDF